MDQLDRKILAALQIEGRRRNADLAREFGVAPSTMLERIRRLEERQYLKGYRALVDPKSLGLDIQALIFITLGQHSSDTIGPFEKGIRNIPYVRVCYHLSGRFDYLVHVAARDLDHLGQLVKGEIAALPGVGKSETFLVFSEIKDDRGWPIELDSVDQETRDPDLINTP